MKVVAQERNESSLANLVKVEDSTSVYSIAELTAKIYLVVGT